MHLTVVQIQICLKQYRPSAATLYYLVKSFLFLECQWNEALKMSIWRLLLYVRNNIQKEKKQQKECLTFKDAFASMMSDFRV